MWIIFVVQLHDWYDSCICISLCPKYTVYGFEIMDKYYKNYKYM